MIVQYHSITYIKIRVPFQAIFKDSSEKPHGHILILAHGILKIKLSFSLLKHNENRSTSHID